MTLKTYKDKRNFHHTPEPSGDREKNSTKHCYVIQKHAASHLHYDFRLEMNGVLKSWAIPKGPCLDPKVKRLAVNVEDHPLSYAQFEGIIPEGEYGGGTVMLWDTGYWKSNEDIRKSYRKGHMIFTLFGEKLHGQWHLVELKDKKNWLLIKSEDKYSQPLDKYDITILQPDSVKSQKNLDQIAKDQADILTKKTLDPAKNIDISTLKFIKKTKVMPSISPQLCTLNKVIPNEDNWLHEIKFDGYRLICQIKNKEVSAFTRNHHNWIDKIDILKVELKKTSLNNIIFDGELVALNENGISDFQLLQNSIKEKQAKNIFYYVFDLLYYDGYDLTNVSLVERKQLLMQVLKTNFPQSSMIRYTEHIQGGGANFLKKCCNATLEGVISKEITSSYTQNRSRLWLKTKCRQEQEFVIGGYTQPKGQRTGFGALIVGYYNEANELQYAGRVGTGFTQKSLNELTQKLLQLKQTTNPFGSATPLFSNKIQWVKPKLVAQIEYLMLTKNGILRHATFRGLREDKNGKEVKLEHPITMHTNTTTQKTNSNVHITHPDKILYKEQNITKQDLAEYYKNIYPFMLPYIINRPLTILRCPNGKNGKCFYQKHLHEIENSSLHTIIITEKNDQKDYLYIKNLKGLLSLIQLDALELHPWSSKVDRLERPDQIIFDLDPAPGVAWKKLVEAAKLVHQHLLSVNLQSFVRTTGSKGLHIVVPIARYYSWDRIKKFSHAFSLTLTQLYPEVFVAIMSKAERKNKIFIDYLRNSRGATAIANYSTRARAGATVATPVSWQEIDEIQPHELTIVHVPQRLEKKPNPWGDFLILKQKLPTKFK